MPSAMRPNPASGPAFGMLEKSVMSVSVMPCLGFQSEGQFFGSSWKPSGALYTPLLSPNPALLFPLADPAVDPEPAVVPVPPVPPAVVAVPPLADAVVPAVVVALGLAVVFVV